jgi:hypothetical protein
MSDRLTCSRCSFHIPSGPNDPALSRETVPVEIIRLDGSHHIEYQAGPGLHPVANTGEMFCQGSYLPWRELGQYDVDPVTCHARLVEGRRRLR